MADLDKSKKDQENPENGKGEKQPDSGKQTLPANKKKKNAKDAGKAPTGKKPPAKKKQSSEEFEDSDHSDSGAEDDYGQEYYYDDFYTESNDENQPETENIPDPSTEHGGPIIPDKPESDHEKDHSSEGETKKSKKKSDEKKMPFLEHLEELRWTLMRSMIAILLGAIICFIFSKQLVDFLRMPGPDDLKLIYLSPTEGFMIYIKVALFSGLVVALPYVSYEFWKFVVPGLLSKERKLVPPIVFFTVFCFLLGGSFAYLVIIPFAMNFLLGFQTEYLEATITIGKYLGFVVTLILVFGVVFELPVLSFFLSKVGLLTPDFLRSKRRYGIVTIVIIAALLTPPDIFTQIMLAIPLIILYEISIYVSAAVVRKKKDQEDDED